LFCQLCPAPIIAITGSSGKTTTTVLVGEILAHGQQEKASVPAAPERKTWVGGNIGQPLIEKLEQIQPDDRVVLELSSFQLEYFHPSANEHVDDCDPMWLPLLAGWSPAVSAILNITPNHLDRHHSMEAYIHAKRAIVAYRQPGHVAVMGMDNAATRAMGQALAGQVRYFGREQRTHLSGGSHLSGEGSEASVMVYDSTGRSRPVCRVGEIKLRGEHNVSNVLAACAIADSLHIPTETMRKVVTTFTGVEHRLEPVGEIRNVWYYNDSIATSPERLVAALKSFAEPIVLLAGGRDKYLPWDEAAHLILQRTRHLILFGEAVELIAGAVETEKKKKRIENNRKPMLHRCVTLEDAVAVAAQVARGGDVVLLSPGCTSFDAFRDFAERGEKFRELVKSLDA
jgi:UDP-N-acetylmuramoylalanine--D-glutamate ligase